MKSKQLANVLIKILGLSFCLYAFIGVIDGAASGAIMASLYSHSEKWDTFLNRIVLTAAAEAIKLALGLLLIFKSKRIAEFLLKEEDV